MPRAKNGKTNGADASAMERTPILKTLKMYVDGAFIRSESGHYLKITGRRGAVVDYCRGSRKDIRDAVAAARKAQDGWAGRAAFNRGQILYRIAEMLEARSAEFTGLLEEYAGLDESAARAETAAAVDRAVHLAGWPDKLHQVLGAINPVSGPFHNITVPEPTGVVGVIAPDSPPLLGLAATVLPVILSGNTAVVIASETDPVTACHFAEVLATSDLPGGVINLLTGKRADMVKHLAGHMDVNAMIIAGQDAGSPLVREIQELAAGNVKRVTVLKTPDGWAGITPAQNLEWIENTLEMKTLWHPIGA